MRVLITGSRDWTDAEVIAAALWAAATDLPAYTVTLISGACPTGADRIAEDYARDVLGWTVERHPADWEHLGKRAGFVRNDEMVRAGADVCLAFIKNDSRGATMTVDLAEAAGIPVRRYTA